MQVLHQLIAPKNILHSPNYHKIKLVLTDEKTTKLKALEVNRMMLCVQKLTVLLILLIGMADIKFLIDTNKLNVLTNVSKV
jgi:hypothetical protein